MIFDWIFVEGEDWYTATSFALSSHRLCKVLKYLYSEPVRLSLILWTDRNNLYSLFSEFIGPNYTYLSFPLDDTFHTEEIF